MAWWEEKMRPAQVEIACVGWDPQAGCDVLDATITVGICLPITQDTGRWFYYEANSPEDLWRAVRDMNTDLAEFARRTWNYDGPASNWQ